MMESELNVLSVVDGGLPTIPTVGAVGLGNETPSKLDLEVIKEYASVAIPLDPIGDVRTRYLEGRSDNGGLQDRFFWNTWRRQETKREVG